jgi:hypothetical protein
VRLIFPFAERQRCLILPYNTFNQKLMSLKIEIMLLAILLGSCTNQRDESLLYLQQKTPSKTPEVFAPEIISKVTEYEFGSVFNAAGTEFFYGVDVNGKSEIRYCKLEGSRWSDPQTILVDERYGFNDPFLSPDEKQLFFISQRPMDGIGELKDYDIWYVERLQGGWSDPINAGPNINSAGNEYYISFNQRGDMYFSSNQRESDFDIYVSKVLQGEFQKAAPLGDSINTSHYEADVFIDPNESYVVFCAERPEGLGRGDLYISFKKADGSWTESKTMGPLINSEKHELCPFVSQDGKYFFYTSNEDIYWVSTEVIKDLRD